MKRSDLLKRLGFCAALWLLTLPLLGREKAQSLPNIVYVLADDLGYGDPRCYNPESKVPTPNMDRLSREGARFTDAHTGSAVCTPTRYGILTGRYAWRTRLKRGVLWGLSPPLIDAERMTVASLLKGQGYRTACVGKWHLGLGFATKDGKPPDNESANVDYDQPVRGGPIDVGFEYFFGIPASLDMVPYVYVENDRVLEAPVERIEGRGGLPFYRGGPAAPGFSHEECLDVLTKKAVRFIDDHCKEHRDKPFFLYFPLTAPHTPVLPTKAHLGKSEAGAYGDFVAQVDWTLGEVLIALDRHEIAEKTLVVFTSDNGSTMMPMEEYGHLPNLDLRGRKSDIWEGGHRVPFLARWPERISAGTVSEETICLTDLIATCAAVVGTDLPEGAGEDSCNILPALEGRKGKPLREAVVHHSIDGMFAVRQGPWKLVLGRGSGGWSSKGEPDDPPGQVYNLVEDVQETRNLYADRPEVVKRLTKLLEKYQREGRSRSGAKQP